MGMNTEFILHVLDITKNPKDFINDMPAEKMQQLNDEAGCEVLLENGKVIGIYRYGYMLRRKECLMDI